MECIIRSEEAFSIEGRGHVVPAHTIEGWPFVEMALASDSKVKIAEVDYILVKAPEEKLGLILTNQAGETISLPAGEHRFQCDDTSENVKALRIRLEQALRYTESVLSNEELKNLMCAYETSPALAARIAELREEIDTAGAVSELIGIFRPTGHWDDLEAPSLPANETFELLCMFRDLYQTGEQSVPPKSGRAGG